MASITFLWVSFETFRVGVSGRAVGAFVLLAVLIRLTFLFALPIGSDDVYRYLWDGKVQSAGINPYQYPPDAEELRHLYSTLLPSSLNHPEMGTVYFPLSQWTFYLVYQLSGENVWGFKLLLLFSEIATLWGLTLILSRLRIPRKFIILYAFCPLAIMSFSIDAHVDALGLPFLIFSLLFHLNGKRVLSLLLLGASMSVKPVGLVLLPLLFFVEKDFKARVQVLLIPLLVVGLQFLPYLGGSMPIQSLETFTKHWTFNGAIHETLFLYVADNQKTRIVCGILLAVALLLLSLSRRDLTDKVYYSILFLLLFSPVVHPWYVTWLAVFLPIARRWSGIVLASTVSLTAFTVMHYKLSGVWTQDPLVLVVEYLPVIVLVFLELRKPSSAITNG